MCIRDSGNIDLSVPDLPLQREISGLGTALDDRITLLRETNATLEAISQALFKSWFVDFDPVRAKMAGRAPQEIPLGDAPDGMDEATAALFPDSFEESELGLVPKGWRVRSLDDVATLSLIHICRPWPLSWNSVFTSSWVKVAGLSPIGREKLQFR